MKTKLLTIITLICFISLSAYGFDKNSAELSVETKIYVQQHKADILTWSRLIAYKTLKKESKKYDCNNLPKPSKNGANEYIRGLCTFVNQNSKQEVFDGLNSLSFAVLNTSKNKQAASVCAASLAFFTSRNYYVARKLANISKQYHSNSILCKTAQNILYFGLQHEIEFNNKLEPGNVCVQ